METLTLHMPFNFPYKVTWNLSFRPYLTYLENQIDISENSIYKNYLRSIAEILYANPILLEPIQDWSILESFKDLINLIQINHIPVTSNEEMYAMGIPMPMRFFKYSDNFKKTITDEKGNLKLRLQDNFIEEEYIRRIYKDILFKSYGAKDPNGKSFSTMMRLTDSNISFKRYFHFITNTQFVKVKYKDSTLPEFDPEWIEYVKGNITSYKLLKNPLTITDFTFEGIMLFAIKDETLEESLDELRENIASMHTLSRKESFIKIKKNTLSLLSKYNVDVGFLPLVEVNKKILYHRYFSYTSILIRTFQKNLPVSTLNTFFDNLSKKCEQHTKEIQAQIFNRKDISHHPEFSAAVEKSGIKSFAAIPVYHQEKLVGIIELTSDTDEAITVELVRRIELAMPMYREFIVYQTDRLHEQMESFIMHNYTAIQPEIEWKFNEIAWEAMQKPKGTPLPEIVFHQLNPFYGAVDIRNSSVERQHAISSDAVFHLKKLQHLVKEKKGADLKLSSQIEDWLQVIDENIADDQELQLRRFIESTTQNILTEFPGTHIPISHDAEHNYEKSIATINNVLKETLDAQEIKLKEIAPVYFDKFRSDGWEYSIYAGKELSPSFAFTQDIISKIKKWEFETVLKMGLSAAAIRDSIPSSLETTQMILAHTNPLDIRFRIDEHRFDVEGSYSIRYEVIKKRIDKICIRETHERLTQPGKIAIVYLYSHEIEVYLEAIKEFIKQGLINENIEYYNLEDMQGVTGLKAIRVSMHSEI